VRHSEPDRRVGGSELTATASSALHGSARKFVGYSRVPANRGPEATSLCWTWNARYANSAANAATITLTTDSTSDDTALKPANQSPARITAPNVLRQHGQMLAERLDSPGSGIGLCLALRQESLNQPDRRRSRSPTKLTRTQEPGGDQSAGPAAAGVRRGTSSGLGCRCDRSGRSIRASRGGAE
jgi:hypothetical protein